MSYWFNVGSGQVESDDNKSQGADLLGPFATQDEAANALEHARQRTKEWDEQDEDYEELED